MKHVLRALGYAPAIMVPRAVSLIVVVVYTRVIEPSQFGLYALIIVYGDLLDAVLLNWSRLGLLRFHHKDGKDILDGLMPGSVAILGIGLFLGVLAAGALSFASGNTSSGPFFLLLVLYFSANGILRFGLNILRAREKQLAYVLIEIIRPLIGFSLAWALVKTKGATFVFLCVGMFSITGISGILLICYIFIKTSWCKANQDVFHEMIRYAVPLILVFFCAHFILASDRFLLNTLSGPAAVGIYAANCALAKPFFELVFTMINLGEFPRLIKAYENHGTAGAQIVLKRTIAQMMFFCIPALVGICLLANPFSQVFIGEEYRNGAPVVIRLVALGAFFAGMKNFVFDQIFHVKKKTLIQSLTLVPAAMVSVGCCLCFIPRYGAIGGAVAFVSGFMVASCLSYYFSSRYFHIIWPLFDVFRIFLGSMAMAGIIIVLQKGPEPERLLYSFPAACAVFIVVCWRSGVFSIFETDSTKQLSF